MVSIPTFVGLLYLLYILGDILLIRKVECHSILYYLINHLYPSATKLDVIALTF